MFEDILLLLLSALITGLSVFISSYVMLKITINKAKTDLKEEVESWLNSEKGQKLIYSVGILLGNAIMAGTGLQKPSKAKGGIEGLIQQAISSFIQGKLPQIMGQQQEQPQEPKWG